MEHLWWPCHLGFCPSQKEWDVYMKKVAITGADAIYPEHGRERGGTFTAFTPDKGDNFAPFGLVTIADTTHETDATTITGILVHESVHAFQWVTHIIKEKTGPSREFEAYGIQSIYQFMADHFSATRTWNDGNKKTTSDQSTH
jgi:hypothetical protein